MESTVDAREERGRQIASAAQIKRVGRRWAVPSQTRASERYLVDIEESACTCPDYEERRSPCKHQHAVLFWIAWGRDVGEDGSVTETVTIRRKTYAQPCWRAYNASQMYEREYVERLLTALCAGIPQPARKPGPGRKPLPLADLVFAAVLKVFLAMSNRRAQSDLRESAARGNVRRLGHFNTPSEFLANPSSTEILTVATGVPGYQIHRDHRGPGTHPVARGRFFALSVTPRGVHGLAFAHEGDRHGSPVR